MYNESLIVSQDYELWCRIIANYQNYHHHITESLVTIRINNESISKKNSTIQRLNSILISLKFEYPNHFELSKLF